MKKLIALIITAFLLTGCTSKMDINISNVRNIKYNSLTLIEVDHYTIISNLNNLTLTTEPISAEYNDKLIVTTEDDIHIFDISNKSIKYRRNGKDYYTDDISIMSQLNSIEINYMDDNFYDIAQVNNYDKSDTDLYLRLDNGDNYYVINTKNPLYNFKINQIIEVVDKLDRPVFNEINLLYENKQLTDSHIVIRSSDNIKITFTNKYNFETTIIPLNTEEGTHFNKTYRQK